MSIDHLAGKLLPHHQALIRNSAISPEVALARGYWSAIAKDDLRPLGFADYQCRVPALAIPIWDVFGNRTWHQARPDHPRLRKGKPTKYETPPKTRMGLDIHPSIRHQLGDPSIPLWITEGSRKVDSVISQGRCCIGVFGVWNWRGTNAQGGKTALADWEMIALNGRRVYLAFDSDVATKPSVATALRRFAAFLTAHGADVRYIRLDLMEASS